MTTGWGAALHNLDELVRGALIGFPSVTNYLATYKGSPAVFTRRPVPTDVNYPIIVVSPDITLDNDDGIKDFRPVQVRDVIAYGHNDTSDHYRTVEYLGYKIRSIFHSRREAIVPPPPWNVRQITCQGPIPGPTDDDQTIARVVSVRFELAGPEVDPI